VAAIVGLLLGLPASSHAGLLVASSTNSSVLQYNQTTGAFTGVFVPSGSGGLNNPQGLALGPDGNLYVASFGSVTSATGSVLRYDGATGAFIDAFVPMHSGGLGAPTDLTFGPDRNLYVSDGFFGTGGVLRYDGSTGAFMGIFASGGGLRVPQGLAFGADRNLYVASVLTDSVLRYNGMTGAPLPAAGQPGAVFIPPGSGGLDEPTRLTFGTDGNVYVASNLTDSIMRYDGTTGAFIDTFISAGSGGLKRPSDLAFGPDGNLYVSAYLDNSVLRYNGETGAFINAFVPSGSGGLSAPTTLVFTPQAIPEPSTLVIGGTAALLGLGYALRDWRRAVATRTRQWTLPTAPM
jgi:DNA-binding beta-propeller fold protein YncE